MLSNFHTHTQFCDGKSSAEEMVISAINAGFTSIGFSGHGYTDFDLSYCMKDTDGYIKEIKRLRDKYGSDIQVYVGVEEDAFCLVDRSRFDYLLGSSHYLKIQDKYYPIDLSYNGLKLGIEALDSNIEAVAESYYSKFTDYIKNRKPDIVGHLDLLTKYDEKSGYPFLNNSGYNRIAEKYTEQIADLGCIVEINTGAIARGHRTTPYPAENLLHILKKHGADIIISSDCHNASDIACSFTEVRYMLKDIGFKHVMTLYDGKFVKDML